MKISFVWQGSSNERTFKHWNDGLREAMRILERTHEVEYIEPWDTITGDVLLYWEAPCTARSETGVHYNRIRENRDIPRALLFAGGPIEWDTTVGFDMYFVESAINEQEMEALHLPWRRAFGVNDRVLKVEKKAPKIHQAFFQATFAGWKRHELFAEAMGKEGVLAGRLQEHDRQGYDTAKAHGVTIFDELSMEDISHELNRSVCVINTSSYWGGGQRTTLEALACNCPVIVMDDSPKNREYVEESGCGIVVPPSVEAIYKAWREVQTWDNKKRAKGRKYIESKWTAQHYADSLQGWITSVCQ